MPQFSSFGPVLRSSKRVELTETDVAEYVVSCIKHTFAEHIIFQFDCRNTLNDILLENVQVVLETSDSDLVRALKPVTALNISKLAFDEPTTAYLAYKKVGGKEVLPMGTFSASLKFISKDCDPQTGEPDEEGYDDTYQVC
jgi:coatomer protein complex subunit gamma